MATCCCARSRRLCASRCALPTMPSASGATNSRCCWCNRTESKRNSGQSRPCEFCGGDPVIADAGGAGTGLRARGISGRRRAKGNPAAHRRRAPVRDEGHATTAGGPRLVASSAGRAASHAHGKHSWATHGGGRSELCGSGGTAGTPKHPEQRKWERVQLVGTRAYAQFTGASQTARVVDLGYGGVGLELNPTNELSATFEAVLHVPILPPCG